MRLDKPWNYPGLLLNFEPRSEVSMSSVVENIEKLRTGIPGNVRLVAVSKTKPPGIIMDVYNTGHRAFGENRVQELLSKKDNLPGDIEWHLIGHLQSNKVKFIAPFISMIQSVDSFKLLKIINREAGLAGRKIDCLLQIHIATEETKFGFDMTELEEMLSHPEFVLLKNITVCGVMGMATFTDDVDLIRSEFRQLRKNFEYLRNKYFSVSDRFKEISMGMSGDYRIAVEEGSTILRIGSRIFGER